MFISGIFTKTDYCIVGDIGIGICDCRSTYHIPFPGCFLPWIKIVLLSYIYRCNFVKAEFRPASHNFPIESRILFLSAGKIWQVLVEG